MILACSTPRSKTRHVRSKAARPVCSTGGCSPSSTSHLTRHDRHQKKQRIVVTATNTRLRVATQAATTHHAALLGTPTLRVTTVAARPRAGLRTTAKSTRRSLAGSSAHEARRCTARRHIQHVTNTLPPLAT